MNQAGVYSATLHYLKAVAALKSAKDGKAVVDKMKEMPTDDPLFGKGIVRADGRKIHPAYLFEVKKPAESKYPGDDYILKATIPADEAFRPLKDDNCPLVTKLTHAGRSLNQGERPAPAYRRRVGASACSRFSAFRRRRCSASCCSA